MQFRHRHLPVVRRQATGYGGAGFLRLLGPGARVVRHRRDTRPPASGDALVDEEIVQKAQQRFSKHVLYEIERPDSLQEFLTSPDVRLAKHFPALVAVGGAEMVADDVQYLTDAEMEEVAERSQMTQMEARRFASVVKRERAKHQQKPRYVL